VRKVANGPLTWIDTYKAHWTMYPRKAPGEEIEAYWDATMRGAMN